MWDLFFTQNLVEILNPFRIKWSGQKRSTILPPIGRATIEPEPKKLDRRWSHQAPFSFVDDS
jgi:hypothetical protein